MFTSTTFLYNSTPNRVLTGAERTIAYRTDKSWAHPAKQAGKVESIKDGIVVVEYEDGSKENIEIGKHFGVWSGTVIPHDKVAMFKVGERFEKDDILTYNSHYFQPDNLNKGKVIFKRGIRGNMVLWVDTTTLEDASTVSRDFSMRLDTGVTEKRSVKVPFDHAVEMLIKDGDHVDAETILCNLKPPMSGFGDRYDDEAKEALDALATLTPRAKYNGKIDKIEIIYTGEVEDMSPSLQELVSRSDAKLYRRNKQLGIPIKDARVEASYRIDNVDIGEDKVVFIFHITEKVGAGIGDKLVYGHQMKSIISDVVEEPHVAEDGTVIDIAFSRESVANRIVNSMDLIGTTNTVLSLIEKRMIEIYLNKGS